MYEEHQTTSIEEFDVTDKSMDSDKIVPHPPPSLHFILPS